MASFIPFVNSTSDATIAAQHYSDGHCFRLLAHDVDRLKPKLPKRSRIWIDAGFDAYPSYSKDSGWAEFMGQFTDNELLMDEGFIARPDARLLDPLVSEVLDECASLRPRWLSVPQLAHLEKAERNRVNRALAKAFGAWSEKRKFRGVAVLPLVLGSQWQYKGKTTRDRRIKSVKECLRLSGATSVWVADTSLLDQAGTANFDSERFPNLIKLHEELAELDGVGATIAGPYWGLNIVLWARGLVTHPAVALGSGYRYYRAGQHISGRAQRVALPPLRRWTRVTPELDSWLKESLAKLPAGDAAHKELKRLQSQMAKIQLRGDQDKLQTAVFYKRWLSSLEKLEPSTRPLALFQDLAAAYVVGKLLPVLEAEKGGARTPWIVARQLMLNCL